MAITALPTPPSRDDPTNFSARGDAFLGALPAFGSEANALAVDVNDDAVAASASASSAAAQVVLAQAAAAAATAAANVTQWVSGTTYTIGQVVFSPINFLSYRRKTDGAGTTDPSLDSANYAQAAGTGDVTLAGTQTLTNKTIAFADNTLTGVAGVTATQTLTNKTISGADNTLTVDNTVAVGFRTVPQNSRSAAYTLVLDDSGKHIFHPAADNNARTFTIPANSSVAYPIGTALTFINMAVANVTIAITTDTLTLSPAGTAGSRTLATNGSATCIKITATQWLISGSGLT